MKAEFDCFGLSDLQRKITGITQIMASIAIVTGLYHSWIGILGALGLCIQMSLGVMQRLKVKDHFYLIIPALFFSILNAYLAYLFFLQLSSR